ARSADIPVQPAKRAAPVLFSFSNSGTSTLLWKIPYQPSYPDYATIQFSPLRSLNQFSVWIEPSFARNRTRTWKLPTHVMWLATDGAIQRSLDLPSREFENNSPFEESLPAVLMPPAVVAFFPFFDDSVLPLQKHRLRTV